MQQNRIIILTILVFASLVGCIEPYSPKEISGGSQLYVISGQVTNTPGYQTVRVSLTSPITKPKPIPVKDCSVLIIDSDNNVFSSTSNGLNGEYPVWIDEEYLSIGKAFKVIITTPQNIVIESEFDTLKPCPDITDLYYKRVDKPTQHASIFIKGIEFQIDLNADNNYDRYYRWDIEETYEYRATYPIYVFYNGVINRVVPFDYSKFYCWATNKIQNIYTLSTKDLTQNRFQGFGLHFIDNTTQRLLHLYSVNVTQIALTEEHFNYWEQLRINSSEQGGLFDSQPINIRGNLSSTSNPGLKVLGFFGAASSKTRRFFFQNVENLPLEIPETCTPVDIEGDLNLIPSSDYPVYLLDVDDKFMLAPKDCFDCTARGGTNVKPSFWP
jgi:hypothetical protein